MRLVFSLGDFILLVWHKCFR